jgi:hypothetical protein
MTTVTIHLALPELKLLQRDCGPLDPEHEDRELVVAKPILDFVDTLKHTVQIQRQPAFRS